MLDQVVAHRAVDEQARSGRAVLAHVHEPGEEDLLGDAVQVGRIGEHDLRALAAHLERDLLEVALRGVVQELAARFGRTGERHHVDVHVPPECLAGVGSRARHDVEDAVRQPGLGRELGHPERRQRRQPGGLDDQAVAGRERRGGLPRRHQQGEVPGDHRAHHADRLADDQAEGVRTGRRDGVEDLVDRLREPAEGPDGIRDVDLAGVGDRLAALERVEQRQFLEVRLEQVGEAEEDLLALGRGAPRPAPVVECPARGRGPRRRCRPRRPLRSSRSAWPVAGFSVTNVSPDAASWNCPSMNAFVRKVGSAATAIESSPAAGPLGPRSNGGGRPCARRGRVATSGRRRTHAARRQPPRRCRPLHRMRSSRSAGRLPGSRSQTSRPTRRPGTARR